MKVADLVEGCLVKPKKQHRLRIQPLYDPTGNIHKLGVEELKKLGYFHHATITKHNPTILVTSKFYGKDTDSIAMYTGQIRLSGTYFGVKKQHTFIVDGQAVIMDGYEIKGFEKIQ